MQGFEPYPGNPNYLVSRDGQVYSTLTDRIMRPARLGRYRGVVLCDRGSTIKKYVHRMVLETYVGPAPLGHEARHLDGDRANNTLANLQWGTPEQNSGDKVLHGTVASGEKNPMAALTWDQVAQIRTIYARGLIGQKNLGAQFGVTAMTINRIVNHKTWRISA